MSRNEMLQYLHNIKVGAQATVATMDMGLQYEYATKGGYGESFGNMGDWPAHVIHNITEEQLEGIRRKLSAGALTLDDLKGTGLSDFYDYVFSEERPEEYIPSLCEFFRGLESAKGIMDHKLYVLCDGREWEPETRFFRTYEELSDEFALNYIDDLEPWDDLDDDELKDWINRIEQELSGIALISFGEDKKVD